MVRGGRPSHPFARTGESSIEQNLKKCHWSVHNSLSESDSRGYHLRLFWYQLKRLGQFCTAHQLAWNDREPETAHFLSFFPGRVTGKSCLEYISQTDEMCVRTTEMRGAVSSAQFAARLEGQNHDPFFVCFCPHGG